MDDDIARLTLAGYSSVSLRLLPWTSEAGTPCYLSTDDNTGYLSRLADEVEDSQTEAAHEVLGAAKAVLGDKRSGYREMRFALARATESLGDILLIAKSRGERLPAPDVEPTTSGGEEEDNGTGEHFKA
ncbi:hypothetical protein [Streptomyces odontomachi]|uniref:hypothetical protein n=1 Tax=Streptomyces odontomachi TaxID=2944940 RepID=UPI00210C24E0|nr:hypothetical protein [Streptomyces sp. ODS25]